MPTVMRPVSLTNRRRRSVLASVRVPNTGLDEVLPSFRRTFREPSPLGLCNIGLRHGDTNFLLSLP